MSETAADNFSALDESGISRFQLKIMFVAGMGFFTDAYDLFVIGIVVALIKGLNRAMVIAGVAAALGMLLTIATLPEPKGNAAVAP